MMMTIVWNPLGFHLLNALPKGNSSNGEYYRDNIFAGLIPLHSAVGVRQLCVHADNARLHIAQNGRHFCDENGLRFLTNLPYFPDLAPSNLFLFGHVKGYLHEMAFATRGELFEAIQRVVEVIPIDTLHRISDDWLERLSWVAENNNEYYP
jgi:hypothetical protein